MKKRPADPEAAAQIAETKQRLTDRTDAFCEAHLNAEYKRLCRKMIDKMARKRPPPFLRGRLDIWAAGIVYALGSANFLFDKSFKPYLSATDLCAHFGTHPGTTAQKAAVVRDLFDLDLFGSTEFLTKHMKAGLAPMEEVMRQLETRLIEDALQAELPPASSASRQGGEFVDGDHPAMMRYYDLAERFQVAGPTPALQSALEDLIRRDPDFYDPYLMLRSILLDGGRVAAAEALLDTAYQRALRRVTDEQGNWPRTLEWGWMENRHIIRTFLNKAIACWEARQTDEALDLFRRLLRANPNDNVSARDYILAIRLGLTFAQFEKKFASQFGYDGLKLMDWFDKNISRFPEDFDWWKEAVAYDQG